MSSETKRWGTRPFWGLSFDYDPQWFLTEEQKEIQKRLIDLCRTTLRPNAVSFKFSPGFMSLDCNPNVFKLQNFVGRNFNDDLTYHGTKSNFSEFFFFRNLNYIRHGEIWQINHVSIIFFIQVTLKDTRVFLEYRFAKASNSNKQVEVRLSRSKNT